MSNNAHFGSRFGPSPIRRVPMPKFEFALEKFLKGRRKRPKEDGDTSRGPTSSAGEITPTDRSARTV